MDMREQGNREAEAARRFHAATKYVAVRDEAGDEQFLIGTPPDVENSIWQEDWSIEPFPFKVYETLRPLLIPRDFPATSMPALEAIAHTGAELDGERVPDLAALDRIALLSNGILKRGSHRPGGDVIEYRGLTRAPITTRPKTIPCASCGRATTGWCWSRPPEARRQ